MSMVNSISVHTVQEGQPVGLALDAIAVEEPLEINILQAGIKRTISITMRTPGHDAELALGFLFTEGIVKSKSDVLAVTQPDAHVAVVELADAVHVNAATLARNFYTASSCGVCGKASIDAIAVQHPVIESAIQVDARLLQQLPALARASQSSFNDTGGCHASSLFTANGQLLLTREDVGRHNALDKVIGHSIWNERNRHDTILLVSGRANFELIQKAAVAGIPVVAAIGAPSSLAVELAAASGISLVGFLKAHRFNIYSHPQRINA